MSDNSEIQKMLNDLDKMYETLKADEDSNPQLLLITYIS